MRVVFIFRALQFKRRVIPVVLLLAESKTFVVQLWSALIVHLFQCLDWVEKFPEESLYANLRQALCSELSVSTCLHPFTVLFEMQMDRGDII